MANKFLIVCGGSGVGLLGQRKVLGIDGEMHIDVREEINESLPRNDPFSTVLKLDLPAPIGTAHQLLLDMKRRVENSSASEQQRNHTNFLAEHWPGAEALKDGLQQVPAFGLGAIQHPDNTRVLDTEIRRIINEWSQDIGTDNPIDFWIVSSTSGGTGEGTHRYVARRIIEALKTKRGARVVLNFIRIGQATYNAVNADRTALNTFFGVAADTAFSLILHREYEGVSVTSRWFYFEVPPVGVGPAAVPVRARLIEVSSKAIMLDELKEPLETMLANEPVGLVRVGYWGKDFDQKAKYYETLTQLLGKLNDLIDPDGYGKYVSGKREPDFEGGEGLQKLRDLLAGENYILKRMSETGWEFPKYSASRLPEDPNKVRRQVEEWRDSISELVPGISMDQLKPRFVTSRSAPREDGGEVETGQAALSVPSTGTTEPYTRSWFEKIEAAQQVLAWTSALLGTGHGDDRLLERLHELARRCSQAQHPSFFDRLSTSTQKKANALRKHYLRFTETLVKVVKLWELQWAAGELLDGTLEGAKKVQEWARREQLIAKAAVQSVQESPVIAARLSDPLDQVTKASWLHMLDTAVRRENNDLFRRQVLAGATGLSYAGLLSVLGLRPSGSAADVKSELRQHMGRMHDAKNKEYQAQWWGATPPAGIVKSFRFRIMPRLAPAVRSDLGDEDGEITYLYTELGVIGLYVLAFEGLKLATAYDTVTTPTYLLSPSVNLVKDYLDDDAWEIVGLDGCPVNKLSIVCAGVGGDVLYKPALIKAGLTEQELEKLSEFYELYDPLEDFRTLSSARCVT